MGEHRRKAEHLSEETLAGGLRLHYLRELE